MEGKRYIQSSSPFFDEDSIHDIMSDIEAMLMDGILTDGLNVKSFEREFGDYIKVRHAIAVNSGTSALEIALRHYELKGREVIVPTNTFVATPNSVLFAGGKPIFSDIKEDTLCIDPEDVERKITSRTAGMIVVHIAGLICPQINQLHDLCREHKLFLIEDAAHAHGAIIDGRKAGSLGDAGCFSFYPTKVMTTGEGGIITTDDSQIDQDARCMRTHGQNSQRQMVVLGHNWRMSEIAAILGRYQLKSLESSVIKRNEIAELYEKTLANIDGIIPFRTPNNIRHSYYKYVIKLFDDINRDELALVLKTKYEIETGNVYDPPCHLHPFYRINWGTKEGDLPIAERVLKKVMCLPMHLGITEKDIAYIIESLDSNIKRLTGS